MPAGVYPELSRRAGMTNLHFARRRGISTIPERCINSKASEVCVKPALYAHGSRGLEPVWRTTQRAFVSVLKDSQPFASENDQVSSNQCSKKKLSMAMSPAKKSSSANPANTNFMMTVNVDTGGSCQGKPKTAKKRFQAH